MSIHFSSKSDEWATPQFLYDALHKEFGFTLDPAATKENAKCRRYFEKESDGLAQSWTGERVFVNPPYGRKIGPWVKKMHEGGAVICVGLLPARTDTAWFHDHILHKAEIRFLRGRLKFGGCTNSAPFPSMIVVWREVYAKPN